MQIWSFCGIGVAIGALAAATAASAQETRSPVGPPVAPLAANVTLRAFAGAEGGYDSNLDNRVASHSSHYEMLQVGATARYVESPDAIYSFNFRGRNYWYGNLETSDRYDIDVGLGATFNLSPEAVLKTGAAYYRDKISVNTADIYKAYADLVKENDLFRARLRFDSRTELSLVDDGPGALDPDVFEVARGKAFDFTKNGVTASLLILRKQVIAPFLIGNFTNIDYIHQAPGAAIDRSANEAWGAAGIRLKPVRNFHIDFGARYNRRDFEDHLFTQSSSSFFDGRFTWKVTPGLTMRGTIERQFKEPTTSFGLADDVITYELALDQRFDSWSFYGRAWLDRVRPVGDNFDYRKYAWEVGVAYELNKTTEVYAEHFGKYVDEKVTNETYDRARFSSGVRLKF
jgi:hypothetical protein